MVKGRQRLRAWATVWLAWQFVSLSAVIPRDCCAAHRPPVAQEAPDGEHCVLHRQQAPPDACVLRGACDGPIAALAALSINQAPALTSFAVVPDSALRACEIAPLDHPRSLVSPPATPPPRT